MKTYVKILGVATVALGLFAFKKKSDYSQVIEKMTWNIANISNLRSKTISGKWKLFFDMDVDFHNNTGINFDFDTAGYIMLRKINVFHAGKLLGSALSNTTKFIMPPNGNFQVTGVQVEVLLADAINDLLTNGIDTNVDNYKLQLQVEALAQTFLIDQPITV